MPFTYSAIYSYIIYIYIQLYIIITQCSVVGWIALYSPSNRYHQLITATSSSNQSKQLGCHTRSTIEVTGRRRITLSLKLMKTSAFCCLHQEIQSQALKTNIVKGSIARIHSAHNSDYYIACKTFLILDYRRRKHSGDISIPLPLPHQFHSPLSKTHKNVNLRA